MIDILKEIAEGYLIFFPNIWAVIGAILFFGGSFVAALGYLTNRNRAPSWFNLLRLPSIFASGFGLGMWLYNGLGEEIFIPAVFFGGLWMFIQIVVYAFFELLEEAAEEEAKADEDAAKQTEGETDNGSV